MISQKELQKLFTYNPENGNFVRNITSGGQKKGTVAGTINNRGYVRININKKKYSAHRLVWLYLYGILPTKEIDHINRDRADNRLKNLREVDTSINAKNRSIREDNEHGVTGVYWKKSINKWAAQITIDYKTLHLGYFIEYHEAVNARKNAEVLYNFQGE